MANLTIAVEDDVLKKARLKALEQGTSVNALLRDYLTHFAGAHAVQQHAARGFLALAAKSKSRRGGRHWTRDELHER